jgi:hypothetical protein
VARVLLYLNWAQSRHVLLHLCTMNVKNVAKVPLGEFDGVGQENKGLREKMYKFHRMRIE